MTDVWLGVMALALVVMAAVQAVAAIQVARMAKQAATTAEDIRRELKPLIEKAHRISDDAARTTALVRTQMERVDQVMGSAAQRIDDTLGLVQTSLVAPIRQGAAVMAGLRAALAVFRARQDRGRYHRDDDDAMFIG